MKKALAAILTVASAAVIVAGAQTASAPTAQAAAKKTELTLDKSRFGKVLFDGKGRALYLFTKDGKGPSQCYEACATAWPPFMKRGRLVAGEGVNKKLLGSVPRTGGGSQVTYAGKPLYYYITDKAPGEITCQNVNEFGGTWYVVKRNGAPVL